VSVKQFQKNKPQKMSKKRLRYRSRFLINKKEYQMTIINALINFIPYLQNIIMMFFENSVKL